jgi:serine/threonine-protein kinase
MAAVWIADDELLSRRVAVKTLRPELATDDALRARFRHEAIAAARLSHPDIVATYDTGDADGLAYIVMELVDGKNVRQLLDERGQLPVSRAVAIARQVAWALDHAHRHGVVHRDIKPANVLVPDDDGPVKVTDFGIAKAVGSGDLTRTGMVVGTARYLAPEQVRGERSDERTDVYALGLLLYEMLAGRPAYAGDTDTATALARLTGPPKPLRSIRPDVPPNVDQAVSRALRPDPAQRFQGATAFAEALTPSPAAVAPSGARLQTSGVRPPDVNRGTSPPGPTRPARAPAPPTTAARARPAPRRPRVWPIVLFVLFLAAAGAAAGFITYRALEHDQTTSRSGGDPAPALAGATDFDPFGDNGGENPDLVHLAIDGDPATAWRSETYVTRDVGGKPGVGLVLDLAAETRVSRVDLTSPDSGFDVAVYVVSDPSAPRTLAAWGPVRGQGHDLGVHASVTLDPSVRGRSVLVWFTRVPASGRLEVSEVQVA